MLSHFSLTAMDTALCNKVLNSLTAILCTLSCEYSGCCRISLVPWQNY